MPLMFGTANGSHSHGLSSLFTSSSSFSAPRFQVSNQPNPFALWRCWTTTTRKCRSKPFGPCIKWPAQNKVSLWYIPWPTSMTRSPKRLGISSNSEKRSTFCGPRPLVSIYVKMERTRYSWNTSHSVVATQVENQSTHRF